MFLWLNFFSVCCSVSLFNSSFLFFVCLLCLIFETRFPCVVFAFRDPFTFQGLRHSICSLSFLIVFIWIVSLFSFWLVNNDFSVLSIFLKYKQTLCFTSSGVFSFVYLFAFINFDMVLIIFSHLLFWGCWLSLIFWCLQPHWQLINFMFLRNFDIDT